MELQFNERVKALLAQAQTPEEISQICKAAGLASGDLIQDERGNVTLNPRRFPPPAPAASSSSEQETVRKPKYFVDQDGFMHPND